MIPSGGWIAAAAFLLLISAGFGLAMAKFGAPPIPRWMGFGRGDMWLIPLALGLALFCALLAR